MAGRGALVLAVVAMTALVATLNIAHHPNLSHIGLHLDSSDLRQHQPRLRRDAGSLQQQSSTDKQGADASSIAASARDKVAAAHEMAQAAASSASSAGQAAAGGAAASTASAGAAVAGIDKPLTADGKRKGTQVTDAPKDAAGDAAAGGTAAPTAAPNIAVIGIDKPRAAASPAAVATEAGAAPHLGAAAAQPAAAAAESGLQQLLSQRVCGSPAVDGYAHVEPKCLYSSPAAKWWKEWEAGGGQRQDLVVHIEKSADYDGLAVAWGIGNTKASVEECAEACRAHKANPGGSLFEPLPCNAFAFCPDEVCFEPDAHSHSKGDCWLKFTEGPASPEVNFRGEIRAEQRARHPKAPNAVQWQSGVLLPKGVQLTNGSWSPRYDW